MKAYLVIVMVILVGAVLWKGVDLSMFGGPKWGGLSESMDNKEESNYASYFVDDYEYDENEF